MKFWIQIYANCLKPLVIQITSQRHLLVLIAIRHAFKTALSKILLNFTTTLKKFMIFGLAGLVSKCFQINFKENNTELKVAASNHNFVTYAGHQKEKDSIRLQRNYKSTLLHVQWSAWCLNANLGHVTRLKWITISILVITTLNFQRRNILSLQI